MRSNRLADHMLGINADYQPSSKRPKTPQEWDKTMPPLLLLEVQMMIARIERAGFEADILVTELAIGRGPLFWAPASDVDGYERQQRGRNAHGWQIYGVRCRP